MVYSSHLMPSIYLDGEKIAYSDLQASPAEPGEEMPHGAFCIWAKDLGLELDQNLDVKVTLPSGSIAYKARVLQIFRDDELFMYRFEVMQPPVKSMPSLPIYSG
jgi:hypothetical protein